MFKSLLIKKIAVGVIISLGFVGCSQSNTTIIKKVVKDKTFKTNQKYICTKIKSEKNQPLFNDSTEIFIDKENILHTNDKENNKLKSFIKSVYKNNYSAIKLEVGDNLYMKRKLVKGKTRGILDVYSCKRQK
jgi:hypothetical protein